MARYSLEQSSFPHFAFASTKSSIAWLFVRIYLGWEWLSAGWDKLHNPAWLGDSAGAALTGFVQGGLAKTVGAHPDVQWWYASFLQSTVLAHPVLFSHMVVYGEILVGAALIIGLFVGLSAFFGALMNMNFMLAGSVSVNPIMFTIAILLILAWRVAGYWGLDRFVLPLFGRRPSV